MELIKRLWVEYGPKSKKFKIFVEGSVSDADVLVDLFESSRPWPKVLNWDINVIQAKDRKSNTVQFPVPVSSNFRVHELCRRLQFLIEDVKFRQFKTVGFHKFGNWSIELFILALWGAACSANIESDVKIILQPSQPYIQNAKDILHALNSQGDGWTTVAHRMFSVKQTTYNLFTYFGTYCVDDVRKLGCSILYEPGLLYIFGPYSKLDEAESTVKKNLTVIKNLPVLTIDNLSQRDKVLQSIIHDLMKYESVYCEFDVSGRLNVYGWTPDSVQKARKEIEIMMKPKTPNVNAAASSGGKGSYSNVNPSQGVTSSRHSASSTKSRTFYTVEKIKVQVYEGNILEVNVDCIVNPADKDLSHRGGIAKEIAKRAGQELKKDCDTYLGEYQQLNVGKACRSSAGHMKYKYMYVIHALGPRWKDYQPITQDSLKECGRLLRSAILESLYAANVATNSVRSIAFPAISAGKLGVPMEFCCVQYARAVIEYSKTAQSKMEIHFVDLRPEMIKMLIDTFDSMIYLDRPPSFYDEKVYIEKDLTGRSDGSKMHGARSDSNNMIYPDCKLMKPPYYFAEEFTCCLGPRQNIFVYNGDILSIPKVDMIVCGETAKGDSSGKLAKLLYDKCGQKYRTNKAVDFIGKTEGDVVFCATEKYRYIAHMCLIPKKQLDPKERPIIIEDMFMEVFEGMKTRNCRTLALPLIGTGQGHGDPEFYAERIIQSLIKFSANNKSVGFDIHLVNFEKAKTDTAIRIIRSEVKKGTKYSSAQLNKPTDSNHSHGRDGRKDNLPNSKNEAVQSSNHPKSARGRGNEHNPIPNKQRPKSSSASGAIRKSIFNDNNYNKAESDYGASKSSKAGKVKEKRKAANDAYNPNAYTENDQLSDDEFAVSNDDNKIQSKPPKGSTYNTQLSDSTRSLKSRSSPTKVRSSLSLSVKSKNEEPKGGNLRIFDGETSKQNNDNVDDNDDGDVDDVDSEPNPNDVYSRGVSGAEYESMTIDSDHDVDDDDDGRYDHHRHSMNDGEDSDPYGDDATKLSEAEDSLDDCVICMDTIEMKDLKKLQCGHKFHADCIEQQFVYKEACPTCGFVCGVITGDQPEGHMRININDNKSCTGYEGVGRIEITYSFPSGRQADYHPEPGKLYKGIQRTAYLPHNKQGRDILEMLRIAFERKLIFTIGSSRTTGADSVITWNDIHHKTDHRPNTQFGYPDPTYLDRVTDELKAKGVTVDDIPTSKKHRRR